MTIDVTPDGTILVDGRPVARTKNPEAVRRRILARPSGVAVAQEGLEAHRPGQ